MPAMIRLNRVIQVCEDEVSLYKANGYKLLEPKQTVEDEKERVVRRPTRMRPSIVAETTEQPGELAGGDSGEGLHDV